MKNRSILLFFSTLFLVFFVSLLLISFTSSSPVPSLIIKAQGQDQTIRLATVTEQVKINTPEEGKTYLQSQSIFHFQDVTQELVFQGLTTYLDGFKLTYQQYYQGLEVYGRNLSLFLNSDHFLHTIQGNYLPNISLDVREIKSNQKNYVIYTIGKISPTIAFYDKITNSLITQDSLITLQQLSSRNPYEVSSGIIQTVSIPAMSFIHTPSTTVMLPQVNLKGETVNVPVEKSNTPDEDGNFQYYLGDALRNIYLYQDIYAGALILPTAPYHNTTGVFDDPQAISMYLNVIQAYDFYNHSSAFPTPYAGINGHNDDIPDNATANNEHIMLVFPHTSEPITFLFPGANFSSIISQDFLAPIVDVIGHEYSHGVSNLINRTYYLNESGAINESFADIFGALIEGYDLTDDRFWIMADALEEGHPSIRDLRDPSLKNYPSVYAEHAPFCFELHNHQESACDYGFVHANSYISTAVIYQMYLDFPQFLTKTRLAQLWVNLLPLLPFDATFADFHVGLIRCAQLLGWDESILQSIKEIFQRLDFPGDNQVHQVIFQGTLPGEIAPAPISVGYGEKFTIPSTTFNRPGYVMVCWSEHSQLSGSAYVMGQEYLSHGQDLILYPIFVLQPWNNNSLVTLEGLGTVSSPFLIHNEREFATYAFQMNLLFLETPKRNNDDVYAVLLQDLDLESVPWIPIGYLQNIYRLHFDGQNHQIKNLVIDETTAGMMYQGLFSLRAIVRNLTLASGWIRTAAIFLGGITGSGSVYNCTNHLNIQNLNPDGRVAGIVADNKETANCLNTGNITGHNAGGIANAPFRTRVVNSVNRGTITGVRAGGIVGGGVYALYLENCVNFGTIQSYDDGTNKTKIIGGLFSQVLSNPTIDFLSLVIIQGCKNLGQIIPPEQGYAGLMIGNFYDKWDTFEGDSKIIIVPEYYFNHNYYLAQDDLPAIGHPVSPDLIGHDSVDFTPSTDSIGYGDFAFSDPSYFLNQSYWVTTLTFDGRNWEAAEIQNWLRYYLDDSPILVTITFLNFDESEIKTVEVPFHSLINVDINPTYVGEEKYLYQFVQWLNHDLQPVPVVLGQIYADYDQVLYAQYSTQIKTFHIQWLTEENEIIFEQDLEWGATLVLTEIDGLQIPPHSILVGWRIGEESDPHLLDTSLVVTSDLILRATFMDTNDPVKDVVLGVVYMVIMLLLVTGIAFYIHYDLKKLQSNSKEKNNQTPDDKSID